MVRAVAGLAGGFFLNKVFLKSDSVGWWIALSALLVALAYILESVRRD